MVSLVSVLHLFAALSFTATLWAIRDHRRRGGLPYPPGPSSLPIIGNLFDIPKEFSWLAYTRFSKKHGTSLSLTELLLQFDCQGISCPSVFSGRSSSC